MRIKRIIFGLVAVLASLLVLLALFPRWLGEEEMAEFPADIAPLPSIPAQPEPQPQPQSKRAHSFQSKVPLHNRDAPSAVANARVVNPALPAVGSGVYKVELGADQELKLPGPPGELLVWIGLPRAESNIPAGMARATGTLPAVGRSAQVTPFAPGIEVIPNVSRCILIHPDGSSTRFQLIPQTTGNFKVGAEVLLFDSADCSGTPVPQAVSTLQVRVMVDRAKQVGEHTDQLWSVFWSKLLEFWGALLVLGFGVVLFLIRKRLKHWFGYGD